MLWYAWRFSISPALHPNEPAELPYLIPFVGHLFSMFTGASRLFSQGKKRFHNQPFSVTTMGQSMYIVTSPSAVVSIYKVPKAIDFDPIMPDFLRRYGLDQAAISAIFRPHEGAGKSWLDGMLDNFKLQLHPGTRLDLLQDVLLKRIDHHLRWENLDGPMVKANGQHEKNVDVMEWVGTIIIDAQTRALFDASFFEACPDAISQLMTFEEEGWKWPLDLPRFAARKMYESMEYVEKGLAEYFMLRKDKRNGESWLIQTMSNSIDDLNLNAMQKAMTVFSIYRTVNANAYKQVFWALSYILFDEHTLLHDLKTEIAPAFDTSDTLNLEYLFSSCPLLASACEEALRLTIWSVGARIVTKDTVIDGKTLRKGRNLLMTYRTMHFSPDVFGADADTFNPTRFMNNKDLVKSPSYRPFGGASHYCPGRFVARKEVQMTVALILRRFDLEVVGEGGKPPKFPKMDDTLPSGGIQNPLSGQFLRVKVRPART
ncbi:cytochrome P450 [Polyplosphaeria fusca]|uniref:Cytochrome P450 n=1 Tax=Polyplosphaeria fusca TaxID=682080 RepID=A0A9P4V3A1_9PLEO|nr:cytochrome P450 [Polyplosphaeria fusca]